MPPSTIYLDNNSTTPIDPCVVEAMTRAWRDCGANPASQHSLGRKARRMLEEAREGILELLGAKTGGMDADQLVFTSGGTEANNLALLGLASTPPAGTKLGPLGNREIPSRVAMSPLEHPSITATVAELARRGALFGNCRVTAEGVVDLAPWREPPGPTPATLVSIMLANNETGVIQPIAEIAAACRQRGALIHTDAVQAVGRISVHFRELGVDAMTVAPHKFHGPLGIGALVVKNGIKLQPQLFGGFQQGGLRPGTENVALAVGFQAALQHAISEFTERTAQMRSLRDQLEQSLRFELSHLVIIGENASRLPNTSCVSFPGLDRQALVMALDLAGVACSTGSACASGSSEPSPTLVAMGLPSDVIQGAIRLSLSAFSTAAEIAEASRRIINTVKHLRAQK
ncbi:MAG TPA: cysteine desulfurase family protein [Pirellulaceae bacterium]